MLESIRQSPLKLGIIIAVLVLLNIAGWYAYFNWDTPLGEPLNIPTPTEVSSEGPDPTETVEVEPTDEVTVTETPEEGGTSSVEPVCGDDNSMTILVTGIDSTSYLFGLADSIRVVRLDFQTKKVVLMAFPRDLWVEIPGAARGGVSVGKLNQAYFFGTEGMDFYDGTGYGSGLLAHTLQHNYGIQIDHYLAVNRFAFRDIVDSLGGISVYLPDAVYVKHYGEPKLFLTSGTHHLDGKEAEAVVRARIDIGDIGRIKNQNHVLRSLVLTMLTPDGIKQLPDLTNRLLGFVLTDLSPSDISQMICLASEIDKNEDITYETVITAEEENTSKQWIMDEFQGFQVNALLIDKNLITQRMADFQAGIWP